MKNLCCRANSSTRFGFSPQRTWTPHHLSRVSSLDSPTLRQRMKLGVFAAHDQPISPRCELTGMTPKKHPLQRGRHQPDPPNLQGLPRAVNNLAVQALLAAYATNTGIVNESSAPQAVKETTG